MRSGGPRTGRRTVVTTTTTTRSPTPPMARNPARAVRDRRSRRVTGRGESHRGGRTGKRNGRAFYDPMRSGSSCGDRCLTERKSFTTPAASLRGATVRAGFGHLARLGRGGCRTDARYLTTGAVKRVAPSSVGIVRRLGVELDRGHVLSRRGAEHPPILTAELGRALVPDLFSGLRRKFRSRLPRRVARCPAGGQTCGGWPPSGSRRPPGSAGRVATGRRRSPPPQSGTPGRR
jgi:hypothetical protein